MTEEPETDGLKQAGALALSRPASPRLMPSLTRSSAEKLRSAKTRVDAILKRYPDYSKATGEYVAALVEVMATYPDAVQDEIADIRQGIAARLKYLPTVADLVGLGNEIDARHRSQAIYNTPRREVDPKPYRPQQIPQFFDKNGNRITEYEMQERAALHRLNQESIRRVNRYTAYCKHLGSGDAIAGAVLMQQRGESDVPDDFDEAGA